VVEYVEVAAVPGVTVPAAEPGTSLVIVAPPTVPGAATPAAGAGVVE